MLKKLPKELRDRKIWINGLLVPYGDLKAKSPVNAELYPVSVTDKKNLCSFQHAVDNHIGDGRLGVGVVFRYSKAFPLVGIDFDVHPEKKELLKLVRKICQESGSYYERSLNGGYHILGLLDTAAKIGKRGKLKTPYGDLKFEVYSHGRYFLCTGKRGKRSPTGIHSVQQLVDKLLQTGSAQGAKSEVSADSPVAGTPSPKMSDKKVLKHLENSKQKLAWLALHQDGDLSDHGGDHSGAVMAWHTMVAFYTQDYEQVTRLFRRSALNRGKWKSENNAHGSKWARVNTEHKQHEKIVAGLKRTFGTSVPNDSSSLGDNKYVLLLKELGEVRRDLFTDEIFVKHEGRWKNAFGTHIENHLKSLCQQRGKDWPVSHIAPALTCYMHSLRPQLLIDIPEWDGVDRLHKMAHCLNLEEESITCDIFEDFLKGWGARLWARMFNPDLQPFMILLQGGSGIGKDEFFKTLVQGLEEYHSYLTVRPRGNEKDYAESITPVAAVIISEFEKTKLLGDGVLKDLMTKPHFTFRSAFAKKSERHYNRTAWLGASNPEHVLNEEGANRRYRVFKLKGGKEEAIRYDYERSMDASKQLVAQYKVLAESGYAVSKQNEALIEKLMTAYAPESTDQSILATYDDYLAERMREDRREGFWLYKHNEIMYELQKIAKYYGISARAVETLLRQNGRTYKRNTGRYYGTKEHATSETLPMQSARKKFFQELKQDSKVKVLQLENLPKRR